MDDINQKYNAKIDYYTKPTSKEFDVIFKENLIPQLKKFLSFEMSYFDGKYRLIINDTSYVTITYEGSQNNGYWVKIEVIENAEEIDIESNKKILKQIYNQMKYNFKPE